MLRSLMMRTGSSVTSFKDCQEECRMIHDCSPVLAAASSQVLGYRKVAGVPLSEEDAHLLAA